MKATKFKTSIEIETLSIDSIFSLLIEIAHNINNEITSGELNQDDGDYMTWEITKTEVEF